LILLIVASDALAKDYKARATAVELLELEWFKSGAAPAAAAVVSPPVVVVAPAVVAPAVVAPAVVAPAVVAPAIVAPAVVAPAVVAPAVVAPAVVAPAVVSPVVVAVAAESPPKALSSDRRSNSASNLNGPVEKLAKSSDKILGGSLRAAPPSLERAFATEGSIPSPPPPPAVAKNGKVGSFLFVICRLLFCP
jgi:hypothetical protein